MYLAVLGRQEEISIAELEAIFGAVRKIGKGLASFESEERPEIARLGGSLKLAEKLSKKPLEFLSELPEGKITLGVSDYSKRATRKLATQEALKLKKILVRHGRSVRVVENRDAVLSTAPSLYNGFSGKNDRKVELIKVENDWYRVIGVQDIDAYAARDQARPARDARVGMLPPKLAQILINLCGALPEGATVLDPFCGTGVVLQEAMLMGYFAYGTDISERMVEYSSRNLKQLILDSLLRSHRHGAQSLKLLSLLQTVSNEPFQVSNNGATSFEISKKLFRISVGDATSFKWQQPIDAVACEGYLGKPMSQVPPEIKLKIEKQECGTIVLGFLKNLASQVKAGVPVVMAVPAWLRDNGTYSRLGVLDEIEELGYNVSIKTREGLIYHRDGQIVARDIIILRKK